MDVNQTPQPWTSLKELLRLAGFQQNTFAALAGIKPYTLSRYLSGQRMPTQETIRKFADLLGVDPGMLLYRKASVAQIEVAYAQLLLARHEQTGVAA